jgi:hypothetical protein
MADRQLRYKLMLGEGRRRTDIHTVSAALTDRGSETVWEHDARLAADAARRRRPCRSFSTQGRAVVFCDECGFDYQAHRRAARSA